MRASRGDINAPAGARFCEILCSQLSNFGLDLCHFIAYTLERCPAASERRRHAVCERTGFLEPSPSEGFFLPGKGGLGLTHSVTSRSSRRISSSACFRSASISSSGRGAVYL